MPYDNVVDLNSLDRQTLKKKSQQDKLDIEQTIDELLSSFHVSASNKHDHSEQFYIKAPSFYGTAAAEIK